MAGAHLLKSDRARGNCCPVIVTIVPPSSGPNGGFADKIFGVLSENHLDGRYGLPFVRKSVKVFSAAWVGLALLVSVGTKPGCCVKSKSLQPETPRFLYGNMMLRRMPAVA